MYVSGINCSPDIAFKEMVITKKAFRKEGGIQGFHIIQSFKNYRLGKPFKKIFPASLYPLFPTHLFVYTHI